MLAFVHIEKAAGTTLIHILRRNFFPRYMDVNPLVREGGRSLTSRDLRIARRVNPFLSVIGGHSVTSHSDLESLYPDIRYVVVFRDPVERYISQFKYWNRHLGKGVSFEQFLDDEATWNVQTKKIAGSADSGAAIRELDSKFLLAGVVEQFDEFLLLLEKRLEPFAFDPRYTVQNQTKSGVKDASSVRLDEYRAEIAARNTADVELYKHVVETLMPRQVADYGDDFGKNLIAFQAAKTVGANNTVRYLDYGLRKAYVQPVTGLIRRLNGLPYRGSYRK
ncbi:MAG: hypothetical protein AAGA44_11155 [Pseudomonadota bacterium]